MLKVIMIDDEKWSLDYMRNIIDWNSYGAEIVGEFNSANQALEYLDGNREVDLVFLDIEMPKMNGLEFLRNVGVSFPFTEFIFISGYDNFEYVREAMRYHATDYLLKPIEKADVLRILKSVKQSREQKLSHLAESTQVGILAVDVQKSAAEIWQDDSALTNVCCMCDTLDGELIAYLKMYFGQKAIYCYRSVFYNSFFIRTEDVLLDAFLKDVRQGASYRFGIYTTKNNKEKFNSMLIKAQSAYDGLWFCEDAGVCVFDEDSEKLLLNYVTIITKCINDGRTNEAHENIDNFVKELRAKALQGRTVILFFNKLIEFLMLHFDTDEEVGEYQLLDINHAKKRFGTPDKMINFLHSIIYEYCATNSIQLFQAKDYVPLIKKYIEDNYQSNLNLSVLAKEFMMSGKYLSSLFKKVTGMNLNRYINMVRVRRAEVMLNETEISVQDISYLCGYGDCSYFTKVFHNIVGVTPTEYRMNKTAKNLQNEQI